MNYENPTKNIIAEQEATGVESLCKGTQTAKDCEPLVYLITVVAIDALSALLQPMCKVTIPVSLFVERTFSIFGP